MREQVSDESDAVVYQINRKDVKMDRIENSELVRKMAEMKKNKQNPEESTLLKFKREARRLVLSPTITITTTSRSSRELESSFAPPFLLSLID